MNIISFFGLNSTKRNTTKGITPNYIPPKKRLGLGYFLRLPVPGSWMVLGSSFVTVVFLFLPIAPPTFTPGEIEIPITAPPKINSHLHTLAYTAFCFAVTSFLRASDAPFLKAPFLKLCPELLLSPHPPARFLSQCLLPCICCCHRRPPQPSSEQLLRSMHF